MMKKIFCALLICFTLLTLSPIAEAGSLSELRDELVGYQLTPRRRAIALQRDLSRLRDVEEGLARQYDLKISDVLAYEHEIEGIINTYYSSYFIQRRGDLSNTFVMDDGRINELVSQKPPYTFAFYLSLIEDIEDCRAEYESQKAVVTSAKTRLQKIAETQNGLERDYRLANDDSLTSAEDRIKNEFKVMMIKARLERCIADAAFYSLAQKQAQSDMSIISEKLDKLDPILKHVRANIKASNDDFEYLDSIAYAKVLSLRSTITMLDEKFQTLGEMRRMPTRPGTFARYWIVTELRLVEDETLLVLDLVEDWAAVRFTWRSLEELLLGKLTRDEQKSVNERTVKMIDDIDDSMEYASDQVQRLRGVEQEVDRRFSYNESRLSDEDLRMKAEFLSNIKERKKRYLSYIVTLGEIKSQFEMLSAETQRIMGDAATNEKIGSLWREKARDVLDAEVWSADDYSVTVRKLMLTVIIFLIGFTATCLIVKGMKRHHSRSRTFSAHSALLVQNLFFYAGVVISFLISLWMLHIPLTAFAFMGGAAAIAIGLGTQKIMGDTLSGLLLLFQKKLRIGDQVVIGEAQGVVKEITLQNTVLLCEESKHLIIPNSKVLESSVLNLTLNNSLSRSTVSLYIPYKSNEELAVSLMRQALSENPKVLKTPPYRIIISDFEPRALKLTAVFFADISENFLSDVDSSIRRQILDMFKEHGIEQSVPLSESDFK